MNKRYVEQNPLIYHAYLYRDKNKLP